MDNKLWYECLRQSGSNNSEDTLPRFAPNIGPSLLDYGKEILERKDSLKLSD